MAYTSLKRVFGETKLELKLLFLFGVGLLLIIVTAFWWYGSKTAKLVYEQNLDTAQLMLQEHMIATHIGAFKIQLVRPGWVQPSPEDVENERQWLELQRKTFTKRKGDVKMIWSHEHPGAVAPDGPDEEEICKKFLSEPPKPSKPGEPENDRVHGTDQRSQLSLLRADPRAEHLFDERLATRRLPAAAQASTP